MVYGQEEARGGGGGGEGYDHPINHITTIPSYDKEEAGRGTPKGLIIYFIQRVDGGGGGGGEEVVEEEEGGISSWVGGGRRGVGLSQRETHHLAFCNTTHLSLLGGSEMGQKFVMDGWMTPIKYTGW